MDYKLKEYGLEQFVSKSKNLLFVTGMAGSGKSTLSKKIAEKYSATYIALDWFFHLENLLENINTSDKAEPAKKEAMEFLKTFFLRYNYVKICDYDSNRITALSSYKSGGVGDKIKQLIEFCIKQKPKRFVLEGIQLYTYDGMFDLIKTWPIVLMLQDENDSYASAKRRTRGYKKKEVKGLRGFILLPWERDFSKAYYARVAQIYSIFVAKIDDYKGAAKMESRQLNASALESMRIPDSEHIGYVGGEPAMELFGMKPKQQQYKVVGMKGGANSVDKEVVNRIESYNRIITFPSKKWPDIFIDTWTNTTDKFNRSGVSFVRDYMKHLAGYRSFVESQMNNYVNSVKTNNVENIRDIARKSNEFRKTMVDYNHTHENILSGIQQPIRPDVLKALKPILVQFQREYEDIAHKESRLRDTIANQGNTSIFKTAKAKQTGGNAGDMYSDLRFFYQDLWEIMSIYKK